MVDEIEEEGVTALWPAEVVKALRRHFHEGVSVRKSAKLLGKTYNQVMSKRSRMGLVLKAASRPDGAPDIHLPRGGGLTTPTLGSTKFAEDLVEIAEPGPRRNLGKTLAEIGFRECRWPLQATAEEATASTLFCAETTKPGSSFCPHHHERVYPCPPPPAPAAVMDPNVIVLRRAA